MPPNIRQIRRKADTTVADPEWHELQQQVGPAIAMTVGNFIAPSGSMAETPDDAWPITRVASGGRNGVLLTFGLVDSADARLANNSTLADVTVIVSDPRSGNIGHSATITAHSLIVPIEAKVPEGMLVTIHLGALTSPPVGIDAVVVYAQPFDI